MEKVLHDLQQRLLRLGPLRPAAWKALLPHMELAVLRAGEGFVRREGQLAYVADGLLKEYDAQGRKRPAIIHFLPKGSFFLTESHHERHYLKACRHSRVLQLQLDLQWALHFKELIGLYNAVSKEYLDGLYQRQLLLEIKDYPQRIVQFRAYYKPCLPYLTKKEMANYLNINYQHFTRLCR